MALGSFLTGNPTSSQQFPTLTPQQLGVKGAASNQALKMLQGLGNNNTNFEPIAQQARSQFQTQTIPGLAERFTSLGQGGQRSSAFQGALGQAGGELEQGLAALRSQHGLQQQGQQNQLLQLLLGTSLSPESDILINEGGMGALQSVFGELAPIIGKLLPLLLGGLLGGPGGAAAGGGLSALNSYFGGQ